MMEIRRARHDELDEMLALYRQLNPDDVPLPSSERVEAVWQQMLGSDMVHCFVVEDDGQLVATCVLTVVPNLTRGTSPYGLIENVVTDAHHRRRGHGKALLEHALAFAWQAGCYKVMLLSSKDRTEAHSFYQAVGFDMDRKVGFDARPKGH